jgi:hypothetical protein
MQSFDLILSGTLASKFDEETVGAKGAAELPRLQFLVLENTVHSN